MAVPSAISTGVIECDGNEVTVSCGFQPSMIQLFYKDAGATAHAVYTWVNGMDVDSDGVNAEFAVQADAGDISFAASAGITLFAGDDDESEGFKFAASLMTTADTIYFVAYR